METTKEQNPITYFNELRIELLDCINNYDKESSHILADDILTRIALNTYFSDVQRKELVELYNKVTKWYS